MSQNSVVKWNYLFMYTLFQMSSWVKNALFIILVAIRKQTIIYDYFLLEIMLKLYSSSMENGNNETIYG